MYYAAYAAMQLFHGRAVDGDFALFAAEPDLIFPFREGNVQSCVLQGEILQFLRPVFDAAGAHTIFGNEQYHSPGTTRLTDSFGGRMDLHSMDLLAAIISSPALEQALASIPYAVDLLLDESLYANEGVGPGNATKPDFLRFLLRNHHGVENTENENGNGMIDHFAADLLKLAAGGTTMHPELRNGLIAAAMNYYYSTNLELEAGTLEEFFEVVPGGITFDASRIPIDQEQNGLRRLFADLRTLTDEAEAVRVGNIARRARNFFVQSGGGAFPATGTAASDVMIGGAGDDSLSGGALGDALLGLDGADTLEGGAGLDVLVGGAGNDMLDGGEHDDWLSGGEGDDVLTGGTGSDVLRGGSGVDAYQFTTGDGADVIEDDDGQGVILFNGGVVQAGERISETKWRSVGGGLILERRQVTTPTGTGYNLIITDGAGNTITVLNWQDGMFDIVLADDPVPLPDVALNPDNSTGNTIAGDLNPLRNADDEIVYDEWGHIIPNGAAPNRADEIFDTPNNDLILAGGGNDTISIIRGGGDVVDGGDGNDHVIVNVVTDIDIIGGAGRDWVQSGGGADIIEGGAGEDVSHGGAGADQIFGDQAVLIADAIETGRTAEGVDAWGDLLDGGLGEDTIVGTATKDLLSGGSGGDLLISGAGDDFISGDGSYAAWVPAGAGTWNWSITLTITEEGGTNVYSYQIEQGIVYDDGGEGDADVIYAGNGNDGVLAGEGDDEVYGEDGDDIIFGDEGNDILIGGAGNDLLDGGDRGEDTTGRDFLDGGEGDDQLSGSDGDDILFGGAGNDQLSGDDGSEFDGSDRLDGEDGDDEERRAGQVPAERLARL